MYALAGSQHLQEETPARMSRNAAMISTRRIGQKQIRNMAQPNMTAVLHQIPLPGPRGMLLPPSHQLSLL